MKYFKYLVYLLYFFFLCSCKKSFNKDIIGPEIQTSSNLINPFQANATSVNFRDFSSNTIKFGGKFEKTTKWKITIRGLNSGATKTITGQSEDISLNSLWDGSQDSLYFFRDGELVIASLSLNNSISTSTYVSQNLENRGDILINENDIARDTILIVKRKGSTGNQFELFPRYVRIGDCLPNRVNKFYLAGYDIEPSPLLDIDPSIRVDESTGFIEAVGDESLNLLTYAKYQGGLTGPRFFMLKGQDISTKISTENGPDYYVGRLASVNLRNAKDGGNRLSFSNISDLCGTVPSTGLDVVKIMEGSTIDNLYFNVFVYGNGDKSKINYTIKEDDNQDGAYQDGLGDESYEKSIVVDFKGWKLFSFPYSSFGKAAYRDPVDGVVKTHQSGNEHQDISNIIQVQFGLVASDKLKKAQMIIDVPSVSVGQPFSY